MWSKLWGSVDTLQKGLEAAWMRDSVIRNNIANAETPDFKGSDVQFESLLAEAIAGADELPRLEGRVTNARHIKIGGKAVVQDIRDISPRVVVNDATSIRMDGNNVDIESENVKFAQNSLYYSTVLAKLNSELTRIKMAVNEGK
ncbi:MAG: flagellar basal body rod protein FlgB [Oscillospiraceae bacterium]|jgi:flagellar basal-body rod protein FlgB|nr:flagellar basal body rod protein FlgB [Oscillospiraceae bacterium]